MIRLNLVVVALGVIPFVVGLSGWANAQSECLSAKLEAIGKKEAGLISCLAKVAAKGRPTTFGACYQKGHNRYAAAFGKAGSCNGDRTLCECLAENCAIAVRLALADAGPSKCEAVRLRAAGKKVAGKFGCNAKAVAKGLTVDQTCIQKVEEKYRAAFARATRCTGDQTNVEAIVDQECVGEVGADPTGGGTVSALCTSEDCGDVD